MYILYFQEHVQFGFLDCHDILTTNSQKSKVTIFCSFLSQLPLKGIPLCPITLIDKMPFFIEDCCCEACSDNKDAISVLGCHV